MEKKVIVSKRGHGDYLTINRAIEKAKNGDVILIKKGIYAETINVTKSLTLIGEEGTEITSHKNTTTINCKGKVEIKNLVLRCIAKYEGSSSSSHGVTNLYSAIKIFNAFANIDNCIIHSGNIGIHLIGNQGFSTIGNCIINADFSGICAEKDSESEIKNCSIESKNTAIHINSGASPEILNCRIKSDRIAIGSSYDGRGEIRNSQYRGTISIRKKEGAITKLVDCELLVDKQAIHTDIGYFTDLRDNERYKQVKIGKQIWITDYLRYKTPSSRTLIDYYHDVKKSHKEHYVNKPLPYPPSNMHQTRLYNYKDALEAIPFGYRIPSERDWRDLIEFFDLGYQPTDFLIKGGIANFQILPTFEDLGNTLWANLGNYVVFHFGSPTERCGIGGKSTDEYTFRCLMCIKNE